MFICEKSLKGDRALLWLTGFLHPTTSEPGKAKIAAYFRVSPSSVKRWLRVGMPDYARDALERLHTGTQTPPTWNGLKICKDGILLRDGHMLPLDVIKHWSYIKTLIDWQKADGLLSGLKR